jgi:two-component system, NtrC family, response regulator AtoC
VGEAVTKYLIVDDSETVRFFLGIALRSVDTQAPTVLEADNRKDALKIFKEESPDIVFLETKVGSDAGHSIMGDLFKAQRAACVVICSGRGAEHPEVREAISHGAFAFLPKPIRLDTVRRTLREVESEIAGLGRII